MHKKRTFNFFDTSISSDTNPKCSQKKRICENDIKYISDDGTIHLNINVKTIDDLIELTNKYVPYKKYNINIDKLHNIKDSLIKLKNMIGLHDIKKNVVDHILYFVQHLQDTNNDMIHIVIQGPPGVGKTMLGKILGEIYYKLNVIKQPTFEYPKYDLNTCNRTDITKFKKPIYHKFPKSNDINYSIDYKFKCVKRCDLIGQYLGWTAKKTQEVIDSCLGGVMFIDEAYSLGNANLTDSFAKECIDTINQNLTEKKNEFLCIIAGYTEDLDSCFFAYNAGLKRRFPFVYTIESYDNMELLSIFKIMVQNESGWSIDEHCKKVQQFFKVNYDHFKNMAGDMETLLFYTKLSHSRRVFGRCNLVKRKITFEDLTCAMDSFKKNRSSKSKQNSNNVSSDSLNYMYM